MQIICNRFAHLPCGSDALDYRRPTWRTHVFGSVCDSRCRRAEHTLRNVWYGRLLIIEYCVIVNVEHCKSALFL